MQEQHEKAGMGEPPKSSVRTAERSRGRRREAWVARPTPGPIPTEFMGIPRSGWHRFDPGPCEGVS